MNWPLTNEPLRIGIIGGGVVGRATARGWMEHARVRVYDLYPPRATASFADTLSSDILFLCLPTPAMQGEYVTASFDEFVARYREVESRPSVIAVRSTVDVGYTRRLATMLHDVPVVHNPEFLTARCAEADYQTPARHLIGLTGSFIREVQAFTLCIQLRWVGVKVLQMQSEESELSKLATNAFFAQKVVFFNLVRKACEQSGCDWDAVQKGILSDGRIAHAHTEVPGPDGQRGYGGTCLPKDMAAFGRTLPDDYRPLIRAIEKTNERLRGHACD